jgi:hypothetical protein
MIGGLDVKDRERDTGKRQASFCPLEASYQHANII